MTLSYLVNFYKYFTYDYTKIAVYEIVIFSLKSYIEQLSPEKNADLKQEKQTSKVLLSVSTFH